MEFLPMGKGDLLRPPRDEEREMFGLVTGLRGLGSIPSSVVSETALPTGVVMPE